MKGCKCTSRLSVSALAIAFGIVLALWMAIFAWFALWSGHGVAVVNQWAEVYQGYAPTMMGGWFGAAWGFVEGFIIGFIFAVIYNMCLCCCKCFKSCDSSCNRNAQ